MDKKGLCDTCVRDKDCSFLRKFPVFQCEEFNCKMESEQSQRKGLKKTKFKVKSKVKTKAKSKAKK